MRFHRLVCIVKHTASYKYINNYFSHNFIKNNSYVKPYTITALFQKVKYLPFNKIMHKALDMI